jgi:hypothetical protein
LSDEVHEILDSLVQRHDRDVGIHRSQGRARGLDLDRADRIGAVEDLALQVGEVDLVGVGQGQPADARRGEVERRRAAKAARADDQRVGRTQPLLSFNPDFGK